MIRVTFDLLPGGDESRARTIGIMEIANIATRLDGYADYAVALKKTPPFPGALRLAWKQTKVTYGDHALNNVIASEDEELITGLVSGHHRTRRGVYDLLFRALEACGLGTRNPPPRAPTRGVPADGYRPQAVPSTASPMPPHQGSAGRRPNS